MDSPNTPGLPPMYTEAYGEENSSTPTGQPSNGSHIRLLTSVDEPSSRPSYQPSVFSMHSRPTSIIDTAPEMPPPESTYIPYSPSDRVSPTKSWSLFRTSSEYQKVPPPNLFFEPADIDGEPRLGTPFSRYGGSPRRPLPPAPLFSKLGLNARNSIFANDVTISIFLENDIGDGDDVFGPGGKAAPTLRTRESYMSNDTLTDGNDEYEHYGPAPDEKQERRRAR